MRNRITKEEKKERGIGAWVDIDRQVSIPSNKLRMGSLKNKIPIQLSDHKTIIFLCNRKKDMANQIKAKWEKHINTLR